MKPRILLLGHNARRMAGTREWLQSEGSLTLADLAHGRQDIRALVRTAAPQLVVMDASIAAPDKLALLPRIGRAAPEARLIVLADQSEPDSAMPCLRAGATAFLAEPFTASELQAALSAVLGDGVYLDPRSCKNFVSACSRCIRKSQTAVPPLTPRQSEVLKRLAEGHSTKQIAALLQISVKTVETHRAHIMGRLEIRDLAGLVRYAIRFGLVHPDA